MSSRRHRVALFSDLYEHSFTAASSISSWNFAALQSACQTHTSLSTVCRAPVPHSHPSTQHHTRLGQWWSGRSWWRGYSLPFQKVVTILRSRQRSSSLLHAVTSQCSVSASNATKLGSAGELTCQWHCLSWPRCDGTDLSSFAHLSCQSSRSHHCSSTGRSCTQPEVLAAIGHDRTFQWARSYHLAFVIAPCWCVSQGSLAWSAGSHDAKDKTTDWTRSEVVRPSFWSPLVCSDHFWMWQLRWASQWHRSLV